MDAISHNLVFRENKGYLNAKNLLMFLRNNERDMTAFLDKTALKRALLDYTGQIRDSFNTVAGVLHITQNEAHSIVAKLTNPKARNDILHRTTDRSISPRKERNGKGTDVVPRDRANPRGRERNPPPTSGKLLKPVEQVPNPCTGCGILGKHG
jgi:hypothetical protein